MGEASSSHVAAGQIPREDAGPSPILARDAPAPDSLATLGAANPNGPASPANAASPAIPASPANPAGPTSVAPAPDVAPRADAGADRRSGVESLPPDKSPGSLEGSSTQVSLAAGSRPMSAAGDSALLDPALLDGQVTIISTRGPLDESGRPSSLAPLEVGRRLEGERLGQFVLKKFVGGGGMGAVFRALDTTLNREVAVKVLSRFQSDEEETLRRFRNEAQSAARLDHGNIARVYYVGFDRGLHYIVFEFIEGENMRDLVDRKGPLPVVEAVSYTLQIAEALTHASQRDVIHRDIKPSNVLVTPEGKAKLVDMGLARLHVDQPDQDITASGVTLGTFDYISPEQARDPRSADVRSDLYSLGCSLFFMLTGQPPFPHGTVLQKLLKHQGDEPPDAKSLRPDLPADVRRILNTLLAKDPNDRFQTPADLILELIAAGRALGLQPPSSVNVDWTLPAQRPVAWWEKHLPWVTPLVALVAIVVALDYVWSSSETRTPPQNDGSPGASAASASPARTGGVHENVSREGGTRESGSRESGLRESGAKRIREGEKPGVDSAKSPHSVDSQPAPSTAAGNRAEPAPSAAGEGNPMPMPGAAGTPAEDESVPAAARQGLLIVGAADDHAPSFDSLAAAVAAAKSGDVIELRYNGVRDERPLWMSNSKLTIRAGERHSPTVRFRPAASDLAARERNMISLSGGQLSVINVRIEFDLPRLVVADDWALFAAQRADLLRFDHCVLTVRNAGFGQAAYSPGVAFFRIQAPSGAASLVNESALESRAVEVQLQNCIARGEATFLDVVDGEEARLEWHNGFLATSERLLAVHTPPDLEQTGAVEVNLRHLTALTRGGLALLDSAADPVGEPGPVAHIAIADSIIALPTLASAPLVEQRVADRAADFRSRLQWSGDRNFYQGFDVFWKVTPTGGEDMLELSYADWEATWGEPHEHLCRAGGVRWQAQSAPSAPFDTLSAGDYALLAEGRLNPAIGSASDGRDAGFLPGSLPSVAAAPADSAATAPAEEGATRPGPSPEEP